MKISAFDLRTATLVHTGAMERARESLLRALLLDREWRYMRDIQRAELWAAQERERGGK